MIIYLKADVAPESEDAARVERVAKQYPDIRTEVRSMKGATRLLTEVHLLGKTTNIPTNAFEGLPGVEKVIRVSQRFHRFTDANALGFIKRTADAGSIDKLHGNAADGNRFSDQVSGSAGSGGDNGSLVFD